MTTTGDDNGRDPAGWGIVREQTIAGFAIKELHQPPGQWLPRHEHPEASVYFVLSGSYRETARGGDIECTRGTVVFKPPLEPHMDRFGRKGGQCLLVEIPQARLQSAELLSRVARTPACVRSVTFAAAGHHIRRELRGVDSLSALAIEALVLETLVGVARTAAGARATDAPTWLVRARELVHDRFTESLGLAAIAAAVDVHPAHLARMFRRHYQTSLGDYIRRLRVERAASDLATSADSVAHIALRCGFSDQSHLSRVFKQHTGETPGRYRYDPDPGKLRPGFRQALVGISAPGPTSTRSKERCANSSCGT